MNNNFSENIKRIRRENNLSQEQLAEEVGVSRQAISKWESGAAYPEMNKIVLLCEKFNLNIDDLLNKDIKEAKGEEESKKRINRYVDDFLKFITDSLNMFINMTLKSKGKCIFEQIIIAALLSLAGVCIYALIDHVFYGIFSSLPDDFYYSFNSIFESVYLLSAVIIGLTVLIHIFKIRYLDYYNREKSIVVNDEAARTADYVEQEENADQDKEINRIDFTDTERKIIIRDPKHSEYKFINGLAKLFVRLFKFFLLIFAVLLSLFLIADAAGLIVSFVLLKTGLLFVGLLLFSASVGVILCSLILGIINFVFNRKNEKKRLIISCISSLIVLGISVGLLFVSTLQFKTVKGEQITASESFEMYENTYFIPDDIKYTEKNIENIELEYKYIKGFNISTYQNDNGEIGMFVTDEPFEEIKEYISYLKNKEFLSPDSYLIDVTVYTSKENIEKLKKNKELEMNKRQNPENYTAVTDVYEYYES